MMRMEHLCLIALGIWVSIVLGHVSPEGKNQFVQSPPRLCVKPGETATFTCNISVLSYNPGDFNWYKIENEPVKIADIQNTTKNQRLHVVINWKLREAKLHILNVTLNDSGKYSCGLVNVSAKEQIIGSTESELFVDSSPSAVTDKTNHEGLPEGNPDSQKTAIIATSVILALLLLLAVGSAIIFIWNKQGNNVPQQQDLEKPPQDPSVYTVNYGTLEFGASHPYRKSTELSISEHVEYATIMFPQQTPSMGEKRGRSA
ncbi:uncharacterized protein LOC122936009 [Bufo gargarizans]|uniref:uncharacterized protein LOC122936009 n=1 Tax=Bufo gargarizans TaxID=30331 RepID=UPI001CF5E7C5|nr:uncharacterized protein LOC122936009 [Bufo gargarizans]